VIPYDLLTLLAEANLACKVGGEENLEQLQYLKGILDPENLFRKHQLRGLTPVTHICPLRHEVGLGPLGPRAQRSHTASCCRRALAPSNPWAVYLLNRNAQSIPCCVHPSKHFHWCSRVFQQCQHMWHNLTQQNKQETILAISFDCNAFITPVSILECPPLQHRLNSDMAQLTISMGIMQQTTTVYAAHNQDRHISLTALG